MSIIGLFNTIFPCILVTMAKLEDIIVSSRLNGLFPNRTVTIQHVRPIGSQALNVTFVDDNGTTGTSLIFRDQAATIELVEASRPLSLDADPALFRLVAEAQRIRWAHLFDSRLAVNTSNVTPLPHQIAAVYDEMLTRQPLRFLLADDPGAGKTIMAGLLLKELILRGDARRILIVAPGSLVEQWQDELDQKFNLPFDILTNEGLRASRTGNWFLEHDHCLARLDKLSRNDDLQEKLKLTDWDLVIFDEAHKLSATWFGNELKRTRRHKLGHLLSARTRQLLLLTATPHNGKEQDFHLFLSLLDGDRFEGRLRDSVHAADPSDLMRRLTKESLVKMDGRPLFPPRYAYTIEFELSDPEVHLYKLVTNYVREEFNRAENLAKGRKGTVGFALTMLQRRLASSPEAIYQSLQRRRERLQKRLDEERLLRRGAEVELATFKGEPGMDDEDLDDFDLLPEAEQEDQEAKVIDLATTAETIAELEAEIATLHELEQVARQVRRSGSDTKWSALAEAIQGNERMRDPRTGQLRKLIIFTEHRDTLRYLRKRLASMFGTEAIVCIEGSTPREQRRAIQESFSNDPEVLILLATDAAGEGINLQRAHLMVNYDLPWNPNRLEQRFGRIHRIGQREACHLWNLVAAETREGAVYDMLIKKLRVETEALDGAVFDVLGEAFRGVSLKDLMIRAVRLNEGPETDEYLNRVIDDNAAEVLKLMRERAVTPEQFDEARRHEICREMQRAEARKLQPHYIGSFFQAAFESLGGQLLPREPRRYEIRHIPMDIRRRDRVIGRPGAMPKSYERITFNKENIESDTKGNASLVCPGHPLLDCTISLILERHREVLRRGTILVDPSDLGTIPRVLYYLESTLGDAHARERSGRNGQPGVISRRPQFVEIHADGRAVVAGPAPYLDYAPPTETQREQIQELLDSPWLSRDLEQQALDHAVEHLVPQHLTEVRTRRLELVEKTEQQVRQRLESEIRYWEARAIELQEREEAGNHRSRLNSSNAWQRAEDLAERLQTRLEELEQDKAVFAQPPAVLGGALVVPAGWLNSHEPRDDGPAQVREGRAVYRVRGIENTEESERLAMEAVMASERELGFEPRDVSAENLGYDIESLDPERNELRFLEVKGRSVNASNLILTRNEVLTALNQPEHWQLVLVRIKDGQAQPPQYFREPFRDGVQFSATQMSIEIDDLEGK